MKILLFGKNGQVGWELHKALQPLDDVIALDRKEADFTHPQQLREIVQSMRPDIIVNAVAYTAVDKAESDEPNAELVNTTAPAVLAEEAGKINALLVHYSTDYVFDGSSSAAYTEADTPNPLNVYGKTKLAGERAIQASGCKYIVLRTSWVYSSRGHNFMLSILRLAREKDELNIVDDQFGAPTSARYIAESTACILKQIGHGYQSDEFESGIYNLVCGGRVSWCEFSREIVSMCKDVAAPGMKCDVEIHSISTDAYPTAAKRPHNSCLDTGKIEDVFGLQVLGWKVFLRDHVQEALQ